LAQKSKQMCIALEHAWHIIFREPPIRKSRNYKLKHSFSNGELNKISSSVAGWRPQGCVIHYDSDTLDVSRDCQANVYVDS